MHGRCYKCGKIVGCGDGGVVEVREPVDIEEEYLLCLKCLDLVKKTMEPGR